MLPLIFIVLFMDCYISGCNSIDKFHVKNLAKAPIDMVTDIHLNRITIIMRQLTTKLYKINPSELKKSDIPGITLEKRVKQIFSCPAIKTVKELDNKQGINAMLLGFEENFPGDRVFAIMYGLYTMILSSYENNCEFFILDQLDQQKLYNSAKNIEILIWRLKTRLKNNGEVFLITNETDGKIKNLSFERLFGKIISIQEIMALIVADQTNRIINEVIHCAGMTFFPLGPS